MNDIVYKIWIGGSCDYGHKEHAGGGAYIIECDKNIIDKFTIAKFNTTEFRMMFKVMIHAMQKIAESEMQVTQIEFLTNVQYMQNFDRLPNTAEESRTGKSKNTANADLIAECIALKQQLQTLPSPINVTVKIVPFHKHPEQAEVHQMASDAMRELRKNSSRV